MPDAPTGRVTVTGAVRAAAAPPGWLTDALGAELAEAAPLPWGFTNESWAATVHGRRLVATRMAYPGSARRILELGPAIRARLAAVGVPTAATLEAASNGTLGVVVSELIEGVPAIEVAGRDGGASLLGQLAGRTWKLLRSVDARGLGLDDLWGRPAALLPEAGRWLDATAPDLPDGVTRVLRAGLRSLAPAMAGRAAGLVHGDFVPVNLLVREDRLVALLDMESVRVGEPLLDAAWFEWILRHHHPAIVDGASAAFAEAAELDREDGATSILLSVLPAIRILEILGGTEPAPVNRPHWLGQLRQLADRLDR